jgi:hypothetical protein
MDNAERLSDEPWIELLLHPVDPAFQLALPAFLAAAQALGLEQAVLVLGGSRAERWDDPGERELLLEDAAVPAERLPQLLAHPDLRHAALIVDPAELDLLPACAACAAWGWQPLQCALTWGLTTLPPLADASEQRFHCALTLAGPSESVEAAALGRGLAADAAISALLARLEQAWSAPCRLSLAV